MWGIQVIPAARRMLLSCLLLTTAPGANGDELATLEGHTNVVTSVKYTPDGNSLLSGSWDGTVRLWQSRTGVHLRTWSQSTDWIDSLALTPDGAAFLAASDRTVHRWNWASGQHELTDDVHRQSSNSAVALSDDGRLLACGCRDASVTVREIGALQVKWRFKTGDAWTKSIAFSADGQLLAAGDWLGRIRIWNLQDGRELHSIDGHPGSVVAALHFHPDGTKLSSGGYDTAIHLWNVSSGDRLTTFSGHQGLVLSLAFSRDGSLLASGERHGPVKLWSVAGDKLVTTLKGHPDGRLGFSVVALAFSPDGRELASAGYDKKIKLWEVPSP